MEGAEFQRKEFARRESWWPWWSIRCCLVKVYQGSRRARGSADGVGDLHFFFAWIDALCIIQADIQERTEHVKVMKSIYKNASTVRIWLGDAIGLEKNIF